MYPVSAQGVDEPMINVHYYYYLNTHIQLCIHMQLSSYLRIIYPMPSSSFPSLYWSLSYKTLEDVQQRFSRNMNRSGEGGRGRGAGP